MEKMKKSQLSLKNLNFYILSFIATFYTSMVYAVTSNDLEAATTKIIEFASGNVLPIASISGLVLGVWRTYTTGAPGPFVICTGAGLGSGVLIEYFQKVYPIVVSTL